MSIRAAAIIPPCDIDEFGRLHDACKREVLSLARAMQRVDAAERKQKALRALAAEFRKSYGTLRRLYYGDATTGKEGWRSAGWRALINRAKYQPVARELPMPFIDYWLELRVSFQRDQSGQAAHDALCAQWRDWRRGDEAKAIAGYDAVPEADPMTGLPRGWSYENLMNYRPKALEAEALRQGRAKALDYRVSILTSRIGLKVGEWVEFDDQWYDVGINFLGVNRDPALRPLGLDALDVASGSYLGHAFLPTTIDLATGKRARLKAHHAHWFVAHVLMTRGFRPDTGSTFVVEHGTMAVDGDFTEQVERATGGKVRFATSGIIDNRVCAGMFAGEGGGNFKFKARLEGARVALRNRQGALPGATGLNPEMAPEEHYYGLHRAETRLLRLMERMGERGALLAHHVIEYHTFVRLALDLYHLLDAEADHELEGWIENGNVVTQWRHALDSEAWHAMEELAAIPNEIVREAMAALVMNTAGLSRSVRLSRLDVRRRHEGELTRVRGAAVPILLGSDAAMRLRVDKEEPMFTVQDQELFPGKVHYLARLKQSREVLARGEEYLVFVDPFGARHAEVCDLDGRWLGTCELWDRPTVGDAKAAGEKFGIADAVFNDELSRNVPRWFLPTVEARTAVIEHNTRVVRGDAVTSEEKSRRRAMRATDPGALLDEAITDAPAEDAGPVIDLSPDDTTPNTNLDPANLL